MIRLILSIILIFVHSVVFAVGAPDYLPDGPRPRIWLTSTELSALAGLRDTGDNKWTALESWCDSHINDAGYNVNPTDTNQDLANWGDNNSYVTGYRMSGWALHLMNYSLAYQVLKQAGSGQNTSKANTYAARTRTLLVDGIATTLRAGEENNGLKALRIGSLHDVTVNSAEGASLSIGVTGYKLGYSARSLAAVPIAYDWIYDTLSGSDKTLLLNMMLRWYDWSIGVRSTYNNGVLISGTRYHEDTSGDCTGINNCTGVPAAIQQKGYAYSDAGNNFGGGFAYMLSLIGVATYGDFAEDDTYLSNLKTYLNNYFTGPLESDLLHSGGDSPEGWNYGGGFIYTLPGLYGYYTATGDTTISSMTWPKSLVRAALHRVSGDFKSVPMWGYWTGVPYKENRISHLGPLIGIEQKLRPSGNEAKVGEWLLGNSTFTTSLDPWQNLFFNSTTVTSSSPSAISEPLAFLSKGNGLFASRSSWDKSNDIVHVTTRLEGKITTAHEGYDEGHITVLRGPDVLLGHQNSIGDAPPSVSFNTIVFNNQSHHANNYALSSATVDRYINTDSYSFVSGDITNAWKRQYQADRCLLFRRSVLHIRPGVVIVYDHTRSNSTLGNLKEWYTQYEADPSQSGNTITVAKGSSKAFVSSLHPAGSFTETNPATGFYRVKFVPTTTQEYDQFLHVIEATGSGDDQTTASLISGTSLRGAKVGDAVAMFTASQNGADITTGSYTVDSTNHYIAGLEPAKYASVTRDSVSIGNFCTGTGGVINFPASSGSADYVVTGGGAACSDTPVYSGRIPTGNSRLSSGSGKFVQ